MYLYHISGNGCEHMKSLIQSIKAVYQLKEEFHPYVQVRFLPYREDEKTGVIVKSRNFLIRKDYTFHDPQDIVNLRGIIWDQLKKEGKIHDDVWLANGQNLNKVTNSWRMALRNHFKNMPDQIILPSVTSEIVRSNILHEVYRLNTVDYINLYDCYKLVKSECYDHFPTGTFIHKKCLQKGHERCSCMFKYNAIIKKIQKMKDDICQRLEDENIPCSKKKLEIILGIPILRRLSHLVGKAESKHDYDAIYKYLNSVLMKEANNVKDGKKNGTDGINKIENFEPKMHSFTTSVFVFVIVVTLFLYLKYITYNE